MKIVNPSCPINSKHPLNEGLVGWWMRIPNSGWSGGLTFRDLVRNKNPNDGTLVNGPTWSGSKGRPGGYGALNFDGVASQVSISGVTELTANWTVAFWARITDALTDRSLWARWTSTGSNRQLFVYTLANNGLLQVDVPFIAGIMTSGTVVCDNKWRHIAITRSGNVWIMYLNANQDVSTTSATTQETGATLVLGYNPAQSDRPMLGAMDDITAYTRALSSAEIRALYDQSRRGHPDTLNWISPKTYYIPSSVSSDTLSAALGAFSLSGKTSNFPINFVDASASFSLSGKTNKANVIFAGSNSSYSLTGNSSAAKRLFTSGNGNYSLSGKDVLNLVRFVAQQSSIVYTGNDAQFTVFSADRLVASRGNFSLSGNALFNLKVITNSTNYLLTGKTSTANRLFTSANGTYSLSGETSNFNYLNRSSSANYSLTGNDAELISLIFDYILSANRGLFTLSGKSAQLIAQYNQLASPDYTKLKGFIDIGKSLIMDQLSDNLIMFFNWSLLNVGAFTNISRSDTLNPFGDRSKLRLVEEPNYVAGRVWESFQGNWVWESGLYYPILPFVPAVYVNNALVTTGFKINYPLGRVIFDVALDADSVVEAKFSVRRYNFYPSNVPWFKQILFASYLANDPHFLETAQGKWADILGQNRITLPAVVVEVSPRRNMRGLQLGGGHWVDIDVLFHIFAEDSWDRDKLIDIISMQREKTIILFDKNALLAADDYPLNDYGDVKTAAKMYPILLEDYSWKRCFFKEVMPQDVLSIPPLFRGVARLTCEIDFPEF